MKENKKIFQKTSNSNKGITLVALVITIVILIILATVAINFAFGNNGLINRAEDAKKYYANDTAYTEEALSSVESYIDGIIGENGGGSGTGTTVADLKPGEGEEVTILENTTPIADELNNTIYVPGGFGIAEDSGTKVEEGIVLEDANGNQFVWIPVGEYKVSTTINAEGKLTNNLSRRTFTSSGATEVSDDSVIELNYYGEGATQDKYGEPITTVAKDQIEIFKTKARNKGGFYIGRYEAGTEEERTSKSDPLTTPLVQANKNAYVYVTRDQAKDQSEAMYSENEFVKSELISSYAWDTALNYICQTNIAGYTLATTTSSTYGNINTSKKELTGAYTADKYSNICDVLGNCYEWTTEFYSVSGTPCVGRGGDYDYSDGYAAVRTFDSTSASDTFISFRLQLYVE